MSTALRNYCKEEVAIRSRACGVRRLDQDGVRVVVLDARIAAGPRAAAWPRHYFAGLTAACAVERREDQLAEDAGAEVDEVKPSGGVTDNRDRRIVRRQHRSVASPHEHPARAGACQSLAAGVALVALGAGGSLRKLALLEVLGEQILDLGRRDGVPLDLLGRHGIFLELLRADAVRRDGERIGAPTQGEEQG